MCILNFHDDCVQTRRHPAQLSEATSQHLTAVALAHVVDYCDARPEVVLCNKKRCLWLDRVEKTGDSPQVLRNEC